MPGFAFLVIFIQSLSALALSYDDISCDGALVAGVTLLDAVHDVVADTHLPEHHVFAIQPVDDCRFSSQTTFIA